MTTFTPPSAPSYSTPVATAIRTSDVSFGDGYKGYTPDGLNTVTETWENVWNNIGDDDAAAIIAALETYAGAPFDWVTPRGLTKRFTCTKFQQTFVGYLTSNVTATFEQSFS